MKTRRRPLDPGSAWEPWRPSDREPWNPARVAHLHRRAGFAAPMGILQRDLDDGPDAAIARLLEGEATAVDGLAAAEFERLAGQMAIQGRTDVGLLRGAWLYRMVHTPHPLRERMTLFWHDHFATSIEKVQDADLMRSQNELLRKHALGDFGILLTEVGKDPAMLVWLDAQASRKSRPNENYAREVMELFALGRGHYGEKDIQEAARALTGRFIVRRQFRPMDDQHDTGLKTILGQTGTFGGDDLVRILLAQPACAEFLCKKLYRYFINEVEDPGPELVAPLAQVLRASGYRVQAVVETILRSRLFHADATRWKRVKSPVEFAVGLVRSLELVKPTVPLNRLADACDAMGQALFAPPNVSGWEWGAGWISTTSLLTRANLALALVGMGRDGLGRMSDGRESERHGVKPDTGRAIAGFYLDLWFQDALTTKVRDQVLAKVESTSGDPADVARTAMALLVTAPEFQVC